MLKHELDSLVKKDLEKHLRSVPLDDRLRFAESMAIDVCGGLNALSALFLGWSESHCFSRIDAAGMSVLIDALNEKADLLQIYLYPGKDEELENKR